MNLSGLTKTLGSAFMQMAMMTTSLSAGATPSGYYSGRRGGYSSGKNKSYLVDPSIKGLSGNLLKHHKTNALPAENIRFREEDLSVRQQRTKELLIVDRNIKNYRQISKLVKRGVELVEIPENTDGLSFLLDALLAYENLEAIHLFSHAQSGEILLGNTRINSRTLNEHPGFAQVINRSVKAGGDFLLYGCELGKGEAGEEFLEIIKGNTHVDVAASGDLTGHAALNGNWDLEIRKGDIETKPLADSVAMRDFTEVLQNVTFQPSTWTVVTPGFMDKRFSVNGVNDATAGNINAEVSFGGRTLKFDGEYNSTNAHAWGIYLGRSEKSVTISFADGSAFKPVSMEIYAYQGDPTTITTNNGGSINFNIQDGDQVGYSVQTIALSSLPEGATSLTITNNGWTPFQVNTNSGLFGHIRKITFSNVGSGAPTNTTPSLTATPVNPTFTENGAAVDLFSSVTANTHDAGQTFQNLFLRVDNVRNGGDEILTIGGTNVVLTNGNSGIIPGIGTYTVSVAGSTATVTLSGMTRDNTQMEALVDGLTYRNTSDNPGNASRTITLTGIADSGSSNFTASLNITSTVSMNAVNDPPVITGVPTTLTFLEDTQAPLNLTGIAISDPDIGTGNVTVSLLANSGFFDLAAGTGVTLSGHVTSSVTITGQLSDVNTYLNIPTNIYYVPADNIYGNSAASITFIVSDNGNSGSGGSLSSMGSISINITAVNDPPALSATGLHPTFSTSGSAVTLFSGASASTIEPGQSFSGLTLAVSGTANGANEQLTIDGVPVSLVHGVAGTTPTNSVGYTVTVSGGIAYVSLNGTLSTATLQTLVDGLAYGNSDPTPTGTTRGVAITSVTDNGGTDNGGIATTSLSVSSTVSICSPPIISGGPSNQSVCVNGTVSFSATITGATSYRWQVNYGSGFLDLGDGGVYSNTGTNTLTITNVSAGMNGYQYRLRAMAGNVNCFTNSGTATLSVSNITAVNAQVDLLCYGAATGSATVSPSGGIGSYTYSWSTLPEQTAATATGLTAGNYSVVIKDAIGCELIKNFTINQPTAPLTLTPLLQTQVQCSGGSNGAATVNAATGGTGAYTYHWTGPNTAFTGQGTTSISGLTAGTWSCTVTDANGCEDTQSFTITQPPALVASSGGQTNVSCNGGANGTATVSVTGGNPGYTYSWNTTPVQTTASATGLAAGPYTVTVTDANNCQTTQSFTITEPTAPLVAGFGSKTDVSCTGGSNGTATVSVIGGTAPYSYSWSPSGGTNTTATGLSAGSYTVIVTDNNSCQTMHNFTIQEPAAALVASFGSQTDVSCNGGSNGTATVSVTGGTAGYTYRWNTSPVQTTATATGLADGTYTVTVTDANTCQTTQSFTITQPTLLSATTSSTDVLCNGGATGTATVTPSGGAGLYTYSWAPSGGTAATATGLTEGNYSCTITDANGCSITRYITINQPSILSATTAQINGTCNVLGQAEVTPSGGVSPYTYLWSTGATSAAISNLAAGNYSVLISDANGCAITKNFTISTTNTLVAITAQTDNLCFGGTSGSASVVPSGAAGPFTYNWSNGGTSATVNNLAAGTYSVVITAGNGCSITKNFTISAPSALVATAGAQTNNNCFGASTGSATVSVTGGTGAYTYTWSPSGGTSATASGLSAGTYTVTVTDANTCTATQDFTISEPAAFTLSPTQTNIACNGASTGSASVTATGGTGVYTYSWSPSGGTAATASGLAAGTYTVTVTDANLCQTAQSFTITEPSALVASAAAQTNVAVFGASTGSATVNVSGGTGAYTYSWAPSGGTAATASGLAAGTYTVTVTDANACQTTQSFTITQPSSALTASISAQTNILCTGASTGSATVSVTGGTAGYTYSWAPSGGTSATASGLAAGTYTVTVTDANSVSTTASVTITQPSALVASAAAQTNVAAFGASTGSATVSVTGGTGAYTYSWAPSGGTGPTATGLAAGTYMVTVTDANACQTTQSFTITQPASALAASISAQTNVSCFNGSNGSATASVSGGTGPYTYSWAPSGGTAATASGLSAGTYTVTVTDANSDSNTASVTITQPSALVASAAAQTNVAAFGASTGSATVSVTGGTGAYTYSWAPSGGTAATATGLAAGTYTVTVTDANNCQTTQSFTITQPSSALAASVSTQTNVSCFNGSNGSASVSVSGGTPVYTYSWAPSGGTGATASGLSAGTYTVTVTDANSISTTATIIITEPSALIATAGGQVNVNCAGASTGSATVNVTGGTGAYTYSWSPSGGSSATASGLTAGMYTVTVKDANLCQTTQSFIITQPVSLSASAGAQTNVAAFGASTGSATVSVTGGTGAYTYSWAPLGGTAATASGLAAGTYTVTVTDANACQTTQSFTITQPASALAASISAQTNVSCFNGSNGSATVSVTGGTGPYTYSWAPSGGTGPTATGLSVGTYTVTVTDANSISTTASVTITEPSALVASAAAQTNVYAYGASTGSATVAVTGGTPGYTYSWSPSGGTAATASGLAAGTYTVTVTDANTCQTTQSFTITQPASALTASISAQTNVLCFNGSNGSATVSVSGGTGPYSYSWAPSGGTGATASGLTARTYTVTVSDANSVSTTATVIITQPSALVATAGAQTNVYAYGASTGSATVDVSGGTGSYSYSWAPSGGSSATATGLAAGTYTVTVTDANACQTTQTFIITQPASALTASISAQTNATCTGASTGSATVSVSGGTGPYTYSWAPAGGTGATASGLSAGTYTVTVTDANSISTTATVIITQPSALVATAGAQTNVYAYGASTGSATVSVTGGTGAYTYSWAPTGGTAATASGLAAGTYTVTVTDANACQTTQSFIITQPASALTASISAQTNATCTGASTGSATVSVSGGTGPYTYSWAPSGGTGATASGLAAGTYTVTVTDANSVSTTASVTITQPSTLAVSLTSTAALSCGSSTGTATASVSGGTLPYTYAWSPTGGNAATATGLGAGTYTLTVNDNNGCTSSAQVVVSQPAPIAASISVTGPTQLCENDQAVLTAANAASYLWSNGATTQSITVSSAGTYTVTLTSAQGCTSSASQIITQIQCNVPPVAVCKEVVVLVAKDNCYATLRPEDIDAGSYDANGDWFNRSFDIQPDLKVGTYYVNFQVQDTHGTTGSCMTRVDVLDHSAPVARTKNITLKLSEGASITPQMIDNGSHDGCGSVQLSLNQSQFDCSHLGENQVILIVTDAAGNKATEVATVTVIDDLMPELLQNTLTLALDIDGKALLTENLVKNIARDNCAVWEVLMDRSSFDCKNIGENHVNITLVDVYSNRTSAVLTVIVQDTLAPVLAGKEVTLYLDAKGQANLSAYKLQDNCSAATLTAAKDSFTCEDLGTHRLLVKATDTYGNTATDTLTVHVKDTLAPVIKTKKTVLALDTSGTAVLSAESVDDSSSDNCGILTRTLSKSSFSCSEIGLHQVIYTLTDASGNASSDTVEVQVIDQTAPTVRTQTVVLELSKDGTATLSADEVNDGSSDNCAIASLQLSQTSFSCTDLGSRTVVLTVVDVNGNSASAPAEVLVRDPEAVCPCSFGIIADAEINLKDNAVMAGGLGVIAGKVILRNTPLDEEGTFVKADQKDFDAASEESKYLKGSAPTITARLTNPSRQKGRKKISGKQELQAGKYGKLVVKKGAEVSASGDIYVRRLVVRKEAKITFSSAGKIIARDRAKFAKNSELSGVSAKLYTARATRVSEGARIKAYVHVGSVLQVKGAHMEGFFAAHTVRGSKNATWSGGGVLCRENENPAQSVSPAQKQRVSADTLVLQAQVSMKISPNPAAESVLVKLHAPSANGQLSLHSLSGSTLASVKVNAQDFQHRFDLKNVLPGTYIVRYQNGNESKTLRLVKEDF